MHKGPILAELLQDLGVVADGRSSTNTNSLSRPKWASSGCNRPNRCYVEFRFCCSAECFISAADLTFEQSPWALMRGGHFQRGPRLMPELVDVGAFPVQHRLQR